MGNLLVNPALFPTDDSGNLYLLHMSIAKSLILESQDKRLLTSPRAIGPVVYATPLTVDENLPLSQGGHLSSLALEVWKNIHSHYEIP